MHSIDNDIFLDRISTFIITRQYIGRRSLESSEICRSKPGANVKMYGIGKSEVCLKELSKNPIA
jgi:hypothetical protein